MSAVVSVNAVSANFRRGHRILQMGGLWLFLGVLVGIGTQPLGSAIAVLSGAVAGAIVMPWLGIILGFLGGRVIESAFGAFAGGCTGIVATIVRGEVSFAEYANLGLVIGGMIGANFATVLAWRAKRRLAGS